MDRDHFSNFAFPHPKEAPYEIWAKLAQRLLKMLTDERTDGRTDRRTDARTDGRTKSDHNSSSWAELRWAKNKWILDPFKTCVIRHPLEPEFRPKFQESGHILSVKKWNLTGMRACVRALARTCVCVCMCAYALALARALWIMRSRVRPYVYVRACVCVENRIHKYSSWYSSYLETRKTLSPYNMGNEECCLFHILCIAAFYGIL